MKKHQTHKLSKEFKDLSGDVTSQVSDKFQKVTTSTDWTAVAAIAGAVLIVPYAVRKLSTLSNVNINVRPGEMVDKVVDTARDLAGRVGIDMPFTGEKESANTDTSAAH